MIVRNIVKAKPTHQVITVKPEDSVRTATEVLAAHRIGAVIVSRDGVIVDGISSRSAISCAALLRVAPLCSISGFRI